MTVHMRLIGTPKELAAAVVAIRATFIVLSVSDARRCRGSDGRYRVYLEVQTS